MTAQMTYRSLYAITERRPEYRSLSLLADFGVPAGPHARVISLAGSRSVGDAPVLPGPSCPVTLMAGPDADDPSTSDGIRPRWWL